MSSVNWNNIHEKGWKKDNIKILSIDGGGIRGVFAARYLSKIEQELGKPICDYFDVITGTSTGGIIALALSIGIPSKEIEELYVDHGSQIFKSKTKIRGTLGKLFKCSYDNSELKKILEGILGDLKIKDASTFLCIPAVEHNKAKPKVFKTPHNSCLHIDANIRMVDVALSTAAAPTYFPAYSIDGHDCKLDGGLWANNPVLLGIAEAVHNDVALSNIKVLSIGTGANLYNAKNSKAFNGGLFSWSRDILDVILNVQAEGALNTGKYLIGENLKRVDFIPTRKISLDSTKKSDIRYIQSEADNVFANTFKNNENINQFFFID